MSFTMTCHGCGGTGHGLRWIDGNPRRDPRRTCIICEGTGRIRDRAAEERADARAIGSADPSR